MAKKKKNTGEENSLWSQFATSNYIENQVDTSLTSQNVILKKGRGQHTKYLPYAFIIDEKVYSLGASLKDMGAGLCAVMEMKAKPKDILNLLK